MYATTPPGNCLTECQHQEHQIRVTGRTVTHPFRDNSRTRDRSGDQPIGASQKMSGREALKNRQSFRNNSPRGAAAREYRDGGFEQARVVQRPGVDRMASAVANDAAEYQPATDRTEVPGSEATAGGRTLVLPRLTEEAQLVRLEVKKRNESRTGCLAAIGTVAVAHDPGRTASLIAYRAAQATTGKGFLIRTHCSIMHTCRGASSRPRAAAFTRAGADPARPSGDAPPPKTAIPSTSVSAANRSDRGARPAVR